MSMELVKALYELGKSLALQGNIKEADEKFKEAIAGITEESDGVEETLYKLYKARLDVNMDNEQERNALTAIMMDIFSTRDTYVEKVLYDLAQVHKITGDKTRYASALEQIIHRFKDPDPSVYFELALMQHNMNDFKGAIANFITYLNKVGKKHPNMQISALNLAACYNATSQPERAQQTLKRFLNLK